MSPHKVDACGKFGARARILSRRVPRARARMASDEGAQLLFVSVVTCLGWVGQGIGLPLFLATFESTEGKLVTGPYFIVSFISLLFVAVFWPLVAAPLWRGELRRECVYARTWRGGGKLFFYGACGGANGLLSVYSSSTSRVPGALQPILRQSTLLFTVLGSRLFLKKRYGWGQLGAACLVLLGIGVSLLPTIGQLLHHANQTSAHVATGGANEAADAADAGGAAAFAVAAAAGSGASGLGAALWPLAMTLACAPVAAMNIVQESIFDDLPAFSVPFLLATTSLAQAGFIHVCFWSDVLPGFGTSADLGAFWANMAHGYGCFFEPASSENPARCYLCLPLGLAYLASLAGSLFYGSKVVLLASANLQALLITLASASCIYFWLVFRGIATWSGGGGYSLADVVTTSLALLPLAAGVILFRMYEPETGRVGALRAGATAAAECEAGQADAECGGSPQGGPRSGALPKPMEAPLLPADED